MLLNQATKPIAALAIVALLATGVALGAGEDKPTDHKAPAFVLDATPKATEPEAEPSAVEIAAAKPEELSFVDFSAPPTASAVGTEDKTPDRETVDKDEDYDITFVAKTWKFDATGRPVDWQSGDRLTTPELERRIREFYGKQSELAVSRSPLVEAELRSGYWNYQAQELSRSTAELRDQLNKKGAEITDDQMRQLSDAIFEAGFARANAIAAGRELAAQLAATANGAQAEWSAPTADRVTQPNSTMETKDSTTAQVGAFIEVIWNRQAEAANGTYRKREVAQGQVTSDGVVELDLLPSEDHLVSPAAVPFVVAGMTAEEIKQAIQTQYDEADYDATVETVSITPDELPFTAITPIPEEKQKLLDRLAFLNKKLNEVNEIWDNGGNGTSSARKKIIAEIENVSDQISAMVLEEAGIDGDTTKTEDANPSRASSQESPAETTERPQEKTDAS